MESKGGPSVLLVDGGPTAADIERVLADHAPELRVDAVADPDAATDALSGADPPAAVVVVCEDDAVALDALAALGAGDAPVPIVAYVEDCSVTGVHDVLAAGAADVVCTGTDRPALLARRVRTAAGHVGHDWTDGELLAGLFESLPHQIFIKDDLGRHVRVSRAAAESAGLTPAEMEGLTDHELLDDGTADELAAEERRIVETGEPVINKVEHYVDPEGKDRWVSTTKAPRYDENGDPVGVLGTTREVTREKRHETMVTALHEASREMTGAETKAEVAAVATDVAATVLRVPVVRTELTDGTTAVVGEGHEADDEAFRTALSTAAAGEVRTVGDPDTPRAVAVPLGNHGALGVAGAAELDEFGVDLVRILAARVEAGLDRAERERELARQNERLEEFAGIVSHDLRNPLNVAQIFIDEAQESGDVTHLDAATDALDRMEKLTGELLTLARQGQTVGERETVHLSEVASAAWLDVDTGGATLRTGDDVVLSADRDRLVELLANCFRNAVEHGAPALAADDGDAVTPGDGLTVSVGPTDRGFYVADDGTGIPADERDSVLRMGYTTTSEGTGYGLYIVSTIAEAHGWSVRITESEAGGARFEFDVRAE